MVSEFTFKKCLEWCTKMPALYCPLESPVFLLKDCECLFSIALEKYKDDWYYNLYMDVKKNEHSEWEPCNIKLLVGFKNDKDLGLGKKTVTMSEYGKKEIWYIEMKTFETKRPSNYMEGNWVKFWFSFEDVAEHLLKIRKETEYKCFQTASYLNTDILVESCIEDMSKLMDTGTDHDAEIKCGEHSIKAHKNILCARSEVFKAMLQSDMMEGRTGIVEIKDIDVSYIRDFVRYLYTGEMPALSFEKARVLYEAGDKYAVRSLVLRCSEYLQDNLSSENAFECLVLADAHSDEILIDSIVTFSLEKKMYLQDKLWIPFCERYPKIVIKVYRLLHDRDTGKKDEEFKINKLT